MVTHEPHIAGYAHQRLFMKDGAVERTEGAA
jgi:ABC-type lipoprotein export system ATPase subunit